MPTNDNNMNTKWIVTTSDLSIIFGISDRAIRKWPEAGCPKLERGKWYLPDVISWKSGSFVEGEDLDKEKLRERKLVADTNYREERAAKERLTREALEGKYMPREEVENEWASRIVELKAGLLNWRKALPPQLAEQDEATIEERLDIEVRDLLEQYYRTGTYTPKVATEGT